MNKLRIQRKGIYTIEVNDNGDTIIFDLEDMELPLKLQKAYDGVQKAQNALRAKMVIIEKQQDKKNEKHLYSKNDYDAMKAWNECFAECRKAMDCFLGEGGCQKIFGDTNYIDMFDDLFEEFEKKGEDGLSHLEKMQISHESMVERIKGKYKMKDERVL